MIKSGGFHIAFVKGILITTSDCKKESNLFLLETYFCYLFEGTFRSLLKLSIINQFFYYKF